MAFVEDSTTQSAYLNDFGVSCKTLEKAPGKVLLIVERFVTLFFYSILLRKILRNKYSKSVLPIELEGVRKQREGGKAGN